MRPFGHLGSWAGAHPQGASDVSQHKGKRAKRQHVPAPCCSEDLEDDPGERIKLGLEGGSDEEEEEDEEAKKLKKKLAVRMSLGFRAWGPALGLLAPGSSCRRLHACVRADQV